MRCHHSEAMRLLDERANIRKAVPVRMNRTARVANHLVYLRGCLSLHIWVSGQEHDEAVDEGGGSVRPSLVEGASEHAGKRW